MYPTYPAPHSLRDMVAVWKRYRAASIGTFVRILALAENMSNVIVASYHARTPERALEVMRTSRDASWVGPGESDI